MVGRLVYYKGLFTALEALTRVPGHLVVVGVGPLEKEGRERARALGVEGRVTWAGYLPPEELAGMYRAATALWFPSNARSEAYGLSQIEAMASGLPVINTAIPHSGVPWVSLHEATGLTVPVGEASALARAARRLLEEPGLAERLGQAARARAEAEFRHDVMAERSLALYAEALRAPLPHVATDAAAPHL
jgi:rhamnosyl/mannosyltransferase